MAGWAGWVGWARPGRLLEAKDEMRAREHALERGADPVLEAAVFETDFIELHECSEVVACERPAICASAQTCHNRFGAGERVVR